MSQLRGTVFNIQKFCIHDGPGIRTTVFFKGCPLRCRWCANPESQHDGFQLFYDAAKCLRCGCCQQACTRGAIVLREDSVHTDSSRCGGCRRCVEACTLCGGKALSMEGKNYTAQEIVQEVCKDEVFYKTSGGGATFSGGEVLQQMNFAVQIAALLHERGISVACETSGYASAEKFSRLLDAVDILLFDVKHYDPQMHEQGTGVDNAQILGNLQTALASGKSVTARIPVIPGFNDRPGDAEGFGELLQGLGVQCVHLLPFHQFGEGKYEKLGAPYAYAGVPSMRSEELLPMQETLRRYVPQVQIGG